MRIHCLQHVPFEDMANIESWAEDRGHELSGTLLFKEEPLPGLDEFEWLLVLGGPMGVHDQGVYPWLEDEKEFIRRAISGGRIVLGICLGAQLIAEVLGGRVTSNIHREIGWHPVCLTPGGRRSMLFRVLPDRFMAFHWHGDTFEVPPGAVHAACSQATANQAFELGRAVGLQFHLESSMDSILHLIRNCPWELRDGPYVQGEEELISQADRIPEIRGLMEIFMDNIARTLG
ncbi:MAG: type 1 glutamine amidotransferase [Methanothrix sp.]|nr:type 1 glutamine amidotransferase [Methanothrix sp.]